jgi:hypothetical protein
MLLLYMTGHSDIGFPVSLVGILLVLRGGTLHDRAHRAAGEPGHVVWGRDDKHRPKWLADR